MQTSHHAKLIADRTGASRDGVERPSRIAEAADAPLHGSSGCRLALATGDPCGPCGTAKSLRHKVMSSGALYSFHGMPRLPMPLCTDLLTIDWSWRRAIAPRHTRYTTPRSDSVCGLYGPATSPRHEVTSSGASCSFHGPPRLTMPLCTGLLVAVDWSWRRATAPRRARHTTTHSDLVCGLHGAATSPCHKVTSSGASCVFHCPPRLPRPSCTHLPTMVWCWERAAAPRRARHVTTHSDKCYQSVHSG